MVGKGHWVVLMYWVAKDKPVLKLGPPGVKEERDRFPIWMGGYRFISIRSETLYIAALSTMQYGQALDHLLREVLLVDPDLGPIYLLKANARGGFYCIDLRPEDYPKLGLVLLSEEKGEDLVAIPLTLFIG